MQKFDSHVEYEGDFSFIRVGAPVVVNSDNDRNIVYTIKSCPNPNEIRINSKIIISQGMATFVVYVKNISSLIITPKELCVIKDYISNTDALDYEIRILRLMFYLRYNYDVKIEYRIDYINNIGFIINFKDYRIMYNKDFNRKVSNNALNHFDNLLDVYTDGCAGACYYLLDYLLKFKIRCNVPQLDFDKFITPVRYGS